MILIAFYKVRQIPPSGKFTSVYNKLESRSVTLHNKITKSVKMAKCQAPCCGKGKQRADYIKERDKIQRQLRQSQSKVSSTRRKQGSKMTDEKLIETVQRLSKIEEELRILDNPDTAVKNTPGTPDERQLEEIQCPICFEEMREEIWCCQNSHPVCTECLKGLEICPSCRENFSVVKPVRNRFAENLISTFLKK